MKKIALLFFIFLSYFSQAQEIRTYNNFSLGTGFSGKSNSAMISYGEMVQKKSILPFRALAALDLKFQSFNKNNEVFLVGKNTTLLRRINTVNIALPLGFEVFQKNMGIGINQEILSIAFKRNYDSTQVQMPLGSTGSARRFSSVFSKKNSLTGQIYLVYTISESFAIKFGIQRENLGIRFKDINSKTQTGSLHSNSIFINIRTNIEK